MCFKTHYLTSIAIFLFGICSLGFAQTGTVSGTILNQDDHPLQGVNITISNYNQGTTTGPSGEFNLALPTGTHQLVISYIGYQKAVQDITIYKDQVINITIELDAEEYELGEITVKDNPSLTQTSVAAARAISYKTPGGVNVTDMQKLNSQRSLTLKDALVMEPGVIIQEFFGSNDQPRLNIRGSGIQSNPQQRGVQLLQDGININQADGTYIIGLLDPRAANHIEVHRGSNALEYGTATLGGAVNMISKSGYNASPLRLKLEGGQYKYAGGSLSSGHVFGNTDLYAVVSYNRSDGYRTWNSSERLNTTVNAGHQFSENLESRFYFTFTDMSFDIPGPLNAAQLNDDATIVNPGVNPPVSIGPNVVRDKPGRASQAFRFATKTKYRISNSSAFSVSAYYQLLDDTFTYPITVGIKDTDGNDGGFHAKYNTRFKNHELKLGLFGSLGDMNRRYYANIGGNKGKKYADNELRSANIGGFASHRYAFSDRLSSILSVQFSRNIRNNTDNFATPDQRPFYIAPKQKYGVFQAPARTLNQSYLGFNPKVGLIYKTTSGNRFYANVSRSYEPPTFDELINVSGGNPNKSPNKFEAKELDAQRATTFEIGSRGQYKRLAWSVSLYRSHVSDEILTTTDLFGISGTTRNSLDRTIHQGIEAGLKATLLQNIFTGNQDRLIWEGVYNFSDFYFDAGPYEGNAIAGIPKHYISSSMEYRHPTGAFLNVNVEWLPVDTPTDHRNTVKQQSYALWGFRMGLHSSKSLSFFIEGKNVFDTTYASSYLIRDVVTNPPPKPITPDHVTTFIPGTGRNFMAGFCYYIN
ncbi:TonB-dependent receptor [Fodinibius halophilus]|uniref:TonB-dependent receptor n=1 Tax=Fodinibius halophilus TaxID=1736908 RepID=A0A6M1SS06_9BACT|nr:TonB-dependent receptor [Fodinibius halophilus]NGP86718.1 TonB-dependent receptor [Fodinibius halophilus]